MSTASKNLYCKKVENNTPMDFFFAPDLRSFLDDMDNADLDLAVDFVCEKFDVSLTDSLLDDITEAFFEHEGVKNRLGLF
jgi:hypothetical protein